MWVNLSGGRPLGVSGAWFPRLLHATAEQRLVFEISRDGLHWETLDEDVLSAGLMAGKWDQIHRRAASE